MVLGDRPHWTALACLRSEEAVLAIEQELRRVITSNDPRERLRLAALVERTADLLAERGFKQRLLDWANLTAQGQPIDDVAAAAIAATQSGITLKTLDFESVTLVADVATKQTPNDELYSLNFATVTVNSRGQEIRRERKEVFYLVEAVGERAAPLQMVAIPKGTFFMGSPKNELGQDDNESPQHEVTISPFFLSKHPITQSQWKAIARLPPVNRACEVDPAGFKGNNRPVEQVSWLDAVEFCDRLSRKTGRTYRLPSEAEWEYACRAGTTTPFHVGETITTDLANYDGNYTYGQSAEGVCRGETTDVGSFPPNAFGLYDMHGNVDEWCLDHWHENYEGAPLDGSAWLIENEQAPRVIRGGSWQYGPQHCRSASRHRDTPDNWDIMTSFRVVCTMLSAL